MTTMLKMTGVTVDSARSCLLAALEYLNTLESDERHFSLVVTPNYHARYKENLTQNPEGSEEQHAESYTFNLNRNGR